MSTLEMAPVPGSALVIDDSRTMRRLLVGWMRDLGYTTVDEASNGREALDRIEAGPKPSVALVDWNMPLMDGLTLIREVRAHDELRDVVLVMVTSESDSSCMVKALVAGADEYVMKPVSRDVLAGKLALLGLL